MKIGIQGVESAITEWEPKAVAANGLIAEAEHLKANINRSQVLSDRLVGLLQSVDMSRNIDQETLAILDPASFAQRSYRVETLTLALGAGFGLFIGLGIVLLMDLRDDRFTRSSRGPGAVRRDRSWSDTRSAAGDGKRLAGSTGSRRRPACVRRFVS